MTSSQSSSVAGDGASSGLLVSFLQGFQVHLEGTVTDLPHLGSSPDYEANGLALPASRPKILASAPPGGGKEGKGRDKYIKSRTLRNMHT